MYRFVNACFDLTQRAAATTALITGAREGNARRAAKEGAKSCSFALFPPAKTTDLTKKQKQVPSPGSIKTNSLISGAERLPTSLKVFPQKKTKKANMGNR